MNILYILLLSIGSYSLLQYVFLPALNKKSESEENVKKFIRLKVTGAVLEFLKTFSLFATIAYAGFLIILGIIWLLHLGGSISGLERSILFIQELSNFFSSIASVWSVIIFVLLIVSLIYITRNKVKQTYEVVLKKLYSEKFSAIKEAFQRNEIEEIPPTEEMNKIVGELEKLEEQKALAQQALANNEISQIQYDDFVKNIKESIDKISTLYYQVDIDRRIKLTPEELKAAKKLAFGDSFIVNNDVLGFFEKTGKWGYKIGLVLLFLSLVSIGGFQMTTELGDEEIDITNILIAKNTEDAKERWDAAKDGYGSEEWVISEEDEQLIDDLATVIESEILDNLEPLANDSASAHSRVLLKSVNTRNRILQRATDANLSGSNQKVRANAKSIGANSSMSHVDELTTLERDVLKTYEAVNNPRNTNPTLKQKISKRLTNELKNKPQLWNEIRPKIIAHKASRAYTKEVAGISRKVFSSVMSNSIKVSGIDALASSNELGKLGQELIETIGTETIENYFEIKVNNILNNTVEQESIAEALKKTNSKEIRNVAINEKTKVNLETFKKSLPVESDVLVKIENKPPSINAKIVEADNLKSMKTISKMKNLHATTGVNDLLSITESVSSYGDFFSPQQGHGSKTARGKQLAKWNPEGFSKSSKIFKGSFSRSRSFVRLRGFSRIGGVLIGHEKEISEDESLDFVDFDWEDSNGKLLFHLTRHDNEIITLGPFKKSLVNHALTYVADARPIAVTMITVEPLFDLKILLHPAFIDTRFGCRVIEIDRFVDTYAGSDFEERETETQRIEAQVALYKLAVKARFDALLDYMYNKTFNSEERAMLMELKNADQFALTFQEEIHCILALDDPEFYWNVNNLIQEKTDFYDPMLSSLISTTINNVGSTEQFTGKVKAFFSKEYKSKEPSEADLERYFSSPPEYQIWSGVREKNFALDENLDFLKFNNLTYDAQNDYPLEFMLQVSFTSEPGFISVDSEDYYDKAPFEFGNLSESIQQRIFTKVDSQDKSILRDMGEFTILQRFFRVVFNGGFGNDFPIEKLYELADITTESVNYNTTLKWNPKPGLIELLLLRQMEAVRDNLETDEAEEWVSGYLEDLNNAIYFLQSNDEIVEISMSEWNQQMSFEKYDKRIEDYDVGVKFDETRQNPNLDLVQMIHNRIKNATLARELRIDLKVDDSMNAYDCPELN